VTLAKTWKKTKQARPYALCDTVLASIAVFLPVNQAVNDVAEYSTSLKTLRVGFTPGEEK